MNTILVMVALMLIPVLSNAQVFIGDGVHISKGTKIQVGDDIILNTDKVSGQGEIVLSGDKKQNIFVEKDFSEIAKVIVKNKVGAEVKGKGYLVVKNDVKVVHGSVFSGKYLGDILYKNNKVNTNTAIAIETDTEVNDQEEEFVSEILGYGFVISINQIIRNTTTSTTTEVQTTTSNVIVVNSNDFINLPLINNYYSNQSSDYYTLNYEDKDFSKIFVPPKIA